MMSVSVPLEIFNIFLLNQQTLNKIKSDSDFRVKTSEDIRVTEKEKERDRQTKAHRS